MTPRDDGTLDGAAIEALLGELGDELVARGVRGEMFVVGGAAMALAYNTRRATRDVDAVFEPKAVVYDAAGVIATRHPGLLTADWLNDSVKAFLPGADPSATVAFDHPGLRVKVASPRYLFVMKLLAARVDIDADDIAVLYRLSGFTSIDDALDCAHRTYGERLEPKATYLLEELLADGRLGDEP